MNFRLLLMVGCMVVTGLFSCKDKDLPPAVLPTTPLTVVNATGDTINYYLNGTRQNNMTDIYPGGSTGYLLETTGQQNYQFKKTGSSVVLFNVPFTLDTATYNSIFVGGNSAAETFKTVDGVPAAETQLNLDTTFTTSMIRFVNASPGSGALSVTVGDTVKVQSSSFGNASAFMQFTANTKEVKVFLPNSSTPKLDTVISFVPGNIYTLFTKGTLTGKGAAVFDVGLINSNP